MRQFGVLCPHRPSMLPTTSVSTLSMCWLRFPTYVAESCIQRGGLCGGVVHTVCVGGGGVFRQGTISGGNFVFQIGAESCPEFFCAIRAIFCTLGRQQHFPSVGRYYYPGIACQDQSSCSCYPKIFFLCILRIPNNEYPVRTPETPPRFFSGLNGVVLYRTHVVK